VPTISSPLAIPAQRAHRGDPGSTGDRAIEAQAGTWFFEHVLIAIFMLISASKWIPDKTEPKMVDKKTNTGYIVFQFQIAKPNITGVP